MIADDCGINRQTFYYHFRDIYDLVEWIYVEDAATAVGDKKTYDTWQQGYLGLFRYVEENRGFILRTYHSLSREHLERFLFGLTYNFLMDVIEEKAGELRMSVRREDKDFIARFYKYGFVGLVVDWIEKGMKENPGEIVERLNTLIYGDIDKALGKFARNSKI